ncbi:MAG: cell division protein ZapA [Magnetococcales bacterium]|nr:cell division protein ZapA [Magnetococcales bacterium]
MQQSTEVRIKGQLFKLRSGAGPAYVADLASFVEGVIDDMSRQSGSGSSDRVAIMAALKIADGYLQLRRQVEHWERTAGNTMSRLIAASDELLESEGE